MPGSGTPITQSRWIASMPARPMCTERSTGVPVRREDAHHGERLVGVVVAGDLAAAMAEHHALAEPVAEPLGHLGAEHGIEDAR